MADDNVENLLKISEPSESNIDFPQLDQDGNVLFQNSSGSGSGSGSGSDNDGGNNDNINETALNQILVGDIDIDDIGGSGGSGSGTRVTSGGIIDDSDADSLNNDGNNPSPPYDVDDTGDKDDKFQDDDMYDFSSLNGSSVHSSSVQSHDVFLDEIEQRYQRQQQQEDQNLLLLAGNNNNPQQQQQDQQRRRRRGLVLVILLLLIALSIGLGIGLSNRKTKNQLISDIVDENQPTLEPTEPKIWFQTGQEIVGEDYGDKFGTSIAVSTDGLVIAVGAPNNNNYYGNHSGHVRVYYKSINGASAFETLSEYYLGEEEGEDVDNSNNNTTSDDEDNVKWIRLGQDIDGEDSDDKSGSHISLSGNGFIVAIGSPTHSTNKTKTLFTNEESNNKVGQVKVYKFNRNVGIWRQVGNTVYGQEDFEEFGSSLSLSDDGKILAVSSALATTYNTRNERKFISGQIRLFKFDNNKETNPLRVNGTVWIEHGSPNIINGFNSFDRLGKSIELSSNGRVVCMSSIYNNDDPMYDEETIDSNNNTANDKYSDIGYVECYRYRSKNDQWFAFGQRIHGIDRDDQFGYDISLASLPFRTNFDTTHNEFVLAISSINNSNNTGLVRVYKFVYDDNDENVDGNDDENSAILLGLGSWIQMGQDIVGESREDNFGNSISLNGNGTLLAIGNSPTSSSTSINNKEENSNVRTYQYDNITDEWQLYGKEINYYDDIGRSPATSSINNNVVLSSDGTTIIIGVPNHNGNKTISTTTDVISTSTSVKNLRSASTHENSNDADEGEKAGPRGYVKIYNKNI